MTMNMGQRCEAILEYAINPALALLPEKMTSDKAKVMLLAIGLQESRLTYRKQIGGPAHGFAQFESGGGVKGVMTHSASMPHAKDICASMAVPFDRTAIYHGIVFNDVLAFGFARLLLYTDAKALPDVGDEQGAWDLYLRTWRPGRPHPQSWSELYTLAVKAVQS